MFGGSKFSIARDPLNGIIQEAVMLQCAQNLKC